MNQKMFVPKVRGNTNESENVNTQSPVPHICISKLVYESGRKVKKVPYQEQCTQQFMYLGLKFEAITITESISPWFIQDFFNELTQCWSFQNWDNYLTFYDILYETKLLNSHVANIRFVGFSN